MPGKKSKAKAADQAPGDPHVPPKPAPLARTTHVPTKDVIDEYVKVVGVENVAGTGIRVLDYALLVNQNEGLPAIPEDVCSVRERLQKLQHETSEPLRYLLRVNLQAGRVALTKGVLSNFALGLYHRLFQNVILTGDGKGMQATGASGPKCWSCKDPNASC